MSEYTICPTVDQTQEFIEIANDFANPLDLVREAVSNSFDARRAGTPLRIGLTFATKADAGETIFAITIADNGSGMGRNELQSFFDLGNSTRRGDSGTIGEKGHGTKVYFNCRKLVVETKRDGVRLIATLDEPFRKLHQRQIPTIAVVEQPCGKKEAGTEITILGYNNNRRDRFTHDRVKDHILWFTKFGSVEGQFGINDIDDAELELKGLDRDAPETIKFGHIFPSESANLNKLFDAFTVHAPKYYCKRIVKSGNLPNHPEIKYNAVFSIEGSRVKYESNNMLRRSGYNAPAGAYTVQERYGVWLCKDFIPVQQKNQWVTSKGSEFTKLHAFFNCQALKLTANRGSIENTPAEILSDVETQVRKMYQEIVESGAWLELSWLEDEAEGYNTIEKERRNFDVRIAKANKANIARLPDDPDVVLVEPQRESGVHSMVVLLLAKRPDLFPFTIIDYDTHEGIEELKHGETVEDINKEQRTLAITAPLNAEDYTRYYLDNPRSAHRIEVFVLNDYLPQKLKVAFRPRTDADIV